MSGSAAAFHTKSSERDEVGCSDEQAEMGSTESLDIINTDADKDDTRQTGHFGKSSSVTWVKRSAQQASTSKGHESLLGIQDGEHALASYHTEDEDIYVVNTANVNPFEWPEERVSDTLLDIYWTHVHNIFPILDKAKFLKTYREFPRGSVALSIDQIIWLAMLNSIWAISCIFAQLTWAEFQPHHDDHSIYIAKARTLGKELDVVYGDPRISMVQFLAMISLYYLTADRLNKSSLSSLDARFLADRFQILDPLWTRNSTCYDSWTACSPGNDGFVRSRQRTSCPHLVVSLRPGMLS